MTLRFDVRSIALAAGVAVAAAFVSTAWWQAVLAAVAVLAFGLIAIRLAPRTAAPAPLRPRPLLTRKETEIAILVARGMTNREIGDRLVISERTVDNHVQHILDKLDFHHRTEVAVWVVEHGLLVRDRAAPP
jgi:DNA-binding NarL/FixJ family response regulator